MSNSNLTENSIVKTEEKLPMSVRPTAEIVLSCDSKGQKTKKPFLEIMCPNCQGANFVKRGTRQKKNETVQLYLCNDCKKTFTPGSTKGRHYPLSVILDAISLYYLGYSLEESAKKASAIKNVNKSNAVETQFIASKTNENNAKNQDAITCQDAISHQDALKCVSTGNELQASTLANWIAQYEPLCAFARMRPFALKLLPPEQTISSATLAHRQLYRFRHHRSKTILIIQEDWKHSKFWPLKEFLDLVLVECPHQYFSEGARASETPLMFSKTEMIVRGKHNFANRMAKFVLESVENSKDRHDALQRFMLANDSVTVATEVPIYLRREDLAHMQTQLGFELYEKPSRSRNCSVVASEVQNGTVTEENIGDGTATQTSDKVGSGELVALAPEELPRLITGHIDFVQIRNGQIHILDYKPNAAKECPIEQLTIYALALSRLTGLKVFNFKCAWFDEKDYFEFFPLHVVYKPDKKRKRRKITTIEGNYKLNDNPKKVEKIRPGM